MTRKIVLFTFVVSTLLWAVKLEDPRTMGFSTSLEFTPHRVDRDTLSNGIEVFLCSDHEVPLVDIIFYVRAGEERVPADHAGLAEILAYMIVEGGSKTVPKRVFEDSLENFGASFNGYASTKNAYFTLHLLSENIPDLFPMVAGAMREPALPRNQLEVNKGQYLTSYAGRNTAPTSVASRVFYKLLYGNDSPEAREVTPAALENIDLEKLAEFHTASYRPGHIMIGVAGDFEPKVMLDLLERYLGDWQEPEVEPWQELPIITELSSPGVYFLHWPGSLQSSVYMGYPSLRKDDPNYPEALMLSEVYGSSWTSRIFNQVREERGLAYIAYGWISGDYTIPGHFTAVCMTNTRTTLEAGSLIIEIIEALRDDGITEDELKQAKQSWLASFPQDYEMPEQVLRRRMTYVGYGYPMDFWDRMPDRIEPLTREDVNRFAADFLKPENLIILVLGDSTSFDGSLSELGEVTIIDPEVY